MSDAEKSAHQGGYGLFSEGVFVAYCKTNKEAISEAYKLGLHGRFSIIPVNTYPEDMGFNGILRTYVAIAPSVPGGARD